MKRIQRSGQGCFVKNRIVFLCVFASLRENCFRKKFHAKTQRRKESTSKEVPCKTPINLFVFVLLLLLISPLQAENLVQKQGQAAATFSANKVKDGKLEIGLSGDITLTLTVEGTAPLEVKAGNRVVRNGTWQVTEIMPGRSSAQVNGTHLWKQVLRVEPMLPGEQKLLLAPLEYREKEGRWQQATWNEVPVFITTKITKVDLSRLDPPPGIEELPEDSSQGGWGYFVVGGLVLAVLLGLGFWLLRRKRRVSAQAVPPDQLALKELEDLQTRLPTTMEESSRFHTRLANILRHYLEGRFQIPAMQQTSEEFTHALAESGYLNEEQLSLFRELLQRCNLPKYAPIYPSPEECLETVKMGIAFVQAVGTSHAKNTPSGEIE